MTKVAVVTGAGTGIGLAAARSLLDSGYRVVLAGRREDVLKEAAAGSPDALAVRTDVTDEASVRALFQAAVGAYGRVDLLFNNAGSAAAGTVGDISLDDWNRIVAVNLTGSFLCAREAFNVMRGQDPRGGRIINNGSISAYAPRPASVAYTATKHAITGLTRSISLDGRAYGIACGQIDIGNAATAMGSRMADGVPQPNGQIMAEPVFDVAHVGTAIRYMAELPLEVNVQFITVMATTMPYVGRG
ncbi:SDR family oxidoreductase [Fodinicola acaciae]|uniref:SDR family oxidoreductase n=1 Tax=Fodinicola acaciae TaxID=2681555 RepID=UPI0013D842E7|nr:SDR family oxidoreductase [Fodinicola acaciae]